MEYYSAIKKNTFESVLMRWMKLEPIIQSEVSQNEKPGLIPGLETWFQMLQLRDCVPQLKYLVLIVSQLRPGEPNKYSFLKTYQEY